MAEFVLPDFVAECLLKMMKSHSSSNKIKKTKGWALKVFFDVMLRGNRVKFEDIYSLFEGCVAQFAGMVRRAMNDELEDDDGSIFGVYRYSSLKKAHASNNEFWDFREIHEHEFKKFFKPISRSPSEEIENASAAKVALLSSFQELD